VGYRSRGGLLMTVPIKIECPKCHADRTMLDTCFGLPAYADPKHHKGTNINPSCVVPVRLVMCPRCHLLEMYHAPEMHKVGDCT
jgi:hypothetical protein